MSPVLSLLNSLLGPLVDVRPKHRLVHLFLNCQPILITLPTAQLGSPRLTVVKGIWTRTEVGRCRISNDFICIRLRGEALEDCLIGLNLACKMRTYLSLYFLVAHLIQESFNHFLE